MGIHVIPATGVPLHMHLESRWTIVACNNNDTIFSSVISVPYIYLAV